MADRRFTCDRRWGFKQTFKEKYDWPKEIPVRIAISCNSDSRRNVVSFCGRRGTRGPEADPTSKRRAARATELRRVWLQCQTSCNDFTSEFRAKPAAASAPVLMRP